MNGFDRRSFLKAAGMTAAAMCLPGCNSSVIRRPEKPNFVFLLIDDMGWTDAGCFGSSFYETPNIDRLASEGMKFTDAYAACPVCSPTRASILTGKYPARIGITDWIPGRQHNGGRADEKLLGPEFRLEMPLEEVTIAERLKADGYATGFVGKWHLGTEDYYPDRQGFDINIAGDDRGSPPDYFFPYKWGSRQLDLPGGQEGEYLTDRLTDEAVEFIRENRSRKFLLYLSHYAVHIPLQAKEKLVAKYVAKAGDVIASNTVKFRPEGDRLARQVQDHAVYAAMIESMDDSVGRVVDELEILGLAEKTVIIFMSDNGGLSTAEGSPTSNLPLRAGKGWLYEGGIREPMIIRWPGVTMAGSKCSCPVTSTDFYPTMLEMTGLDPDDSQHVDGVSLCGLLQGDLSVERQAIYWHYPHYSNQGGRPGGAVRMGSYKLIENYEDMSIELYDLRNDIGEQKNLAGIMPQKAEAMRELLHIWRNETGADMPGDNPNYKPQEDKSQNTIFQGEVNPSVTG